MNQPILSLQLLTEVPMNSKTVLICDHNKDMITILRILFKRWGINVDGVRSGPEALVYLREHPETAAVIVELTMPVMNGSEFLQIKSNDSLISKVPVLILSGATNIEEVAIEFQIKDFMEKAGSNDYFFEILLDKLRGKIEEETWMQAYNKVA